MLSNEAVGENDKTDFLNSDKDFAVAVQPEGIVTIINYN